MNQKPVENNSFAPSKPPAYIPPAKRPGQIPPMYQPPADSLAGQFPNSTAPAPDSQHPPFQPGQAAAPAAPDQAATIRPSVPANAGAVPPSPAGAPGPTHHNRPAAPPPGYYQPVPRKQRADYQYLAKRSYTSKGSAAVFFAILFCMFYTELVLWGNLGISILILVAAYYAFSFWYFHEPDRRFSPAALLITIPIVVLTIGLCSSVNSSTYFITVPSLICLLAAQTALLGGMKYRSFFSWETFCALWAHLIDGPLAFLDFPFLVMGRRDKKGQRPKNSWKIFLGLLCALPFVALLLWLFASADAVFRTGLQNLARWLRIDWSHLFADALMGFLGGIFLSAVLLYCRGALPRDPLPIKGKRILDPLFAIPFLGLIDLSVLAFTFVQFAYLFGGEKGSLPGGYTYAEYARQGFFELAVALFLIFAIALLAMALCKSDRPGLYLVARLELLVLSLGGGVILCSAVKRMLLYVNVYGLSVKRGLTLWFMATASICFLFLAARCLLRRFPLVKCAGITVAVMVCVLSLFPMDGFVARYNVNAYLAGRTETEVDYYYLENLSVSALPAMVDLYLHAPSNDLAWAINQQIQDNDNRHTLWGWTIDQIGIQESIRLFRQTAGNQSSNTETPF
ncbi:MAG: DUF4173 domain-containing protein [Oscillospiraceae bacterium]|nr:DUF4173 domain-containing protein [Oscillospiraceae bacterium]